MDERSRFSFNGILPAAFWSHTRSEESRSNNTSLMHLTRHITVAVMRMMDGIKQSPTSKGNKLH